MHEPVDTTEISLLAQWKCRHCGQTLQAKEPTTEVVSTCGALYRIHWEHDGIYATAVEQIGQGESAELTIPDRGQEESDSERNTHFRNWATHLYEDLRGKLYVLFLTWTTHPHDQEREETAELAIKNTLAQHGYDLVRHALRELLLERDIVEEIRNIPDLTEQPEKPE